jgi:hypothetical protein
MSQDLSSDSLRASSNFLPPKWLLGSRLVSVAWILMHFVWSISNVGGDWFRFLTNLSWIGLLIHFALAAATSVYALHSVPMSTKFNAVFDAFFACAISIPWIVTIGYWGLLLSLYTSKTNDVDRFLSLDPHAINMVLMLFELIFSRNPVFVWGFLWPLLAIYLYAALCVLLRYPFNIDWPYGFMKGLLETSPGVTIASLVGIGLVIIVLYFCSFGISRIRNRFERKHVHEEEGKPHV